MNGDVKRLIFGQIRDTGKTKTWRVLSGVLRLGTIKWYANWRRYCFFPEDSTLFDRNCLMEIVDFIDSEMRHRKSPTLVPEGAATSEAQK